ncbi:MAG: protein-L-isoaspartate(D-aspartate) O-methyltransferase [Methylococcales bacterium]|jgi:protein-L-isoaspartate(D-aspartate) O-methyltransferase|nr:protein-L-isoaspartate(D-aspartate) O-methyltransferase [Methylococcales bacterium]MBT3507040.1 protein-L-isoaspartate(D-aspartate) O-methyltransferase [Methylococcales bacterium]MBT3699509.1 protein-L-isoaspartate(D-aspartate) O-methyltransferase [Methylococcales bacterium]MBT3816279.1 protein-L-isoaspartate(D-aspartate) O-methyltransferase [Methylococcales bacterium]MBT4031356.1 protein-L-isoaspartate(D-aspartate) O-methyltransferase [Methylococcales bacterium]
MKTREGIGMTSRRTRNRMIDRLMGQGISNHSVLNVMRDTPRHLFMDEALSSRAYEDVALPIGYNQTISQPYIVAKMTEVLVDHGVTGSVLEIGTGCGYQAAVLAQMVDQVYSVERILPLQKKASKLLMDLSIRNIKYLHSDGGWGWPDFAPYEGILVAAAPTEIPKGLLQQMKEGGVMIIPVGPQGDQALQKVVKTATGFDIENIEAVSFVPFVQGRR